MMMIMMITMMMMMMMTMMTMIILIIVMIIMIMIMIIVSCNSNNLNLQRRPTQLRVYPNRALLHQNGQVPTQIEETPDRNGHERITLRSCSAITRQRQIPGKK